MAEPSATLASHPPGETPKSANERHLLQNMSLNRVEDFSIADVGILFLGAAWFKKARSGQEVERCGYHCLTIIFSSRLKPSGIVPGFFMIGFRRDRCEAAFLFL